MNTELFEMISSFIRFLLKNTSFYTLAYGMTELLFVTIDRRGQARPGLTGKLIPSVEAKVLDLVDGTTTLPAGEDGEICIKSESVRIEENAPKT